MATRQELEKSWKALLSAFPNNKVDAGTAAIYAATLQDIDGEILNAGVLDCITRCKFFPTVAEIREAAFSVSSARIAQPTALEAWGHVKAMVGDFGYYRVPDVSDFADHTAGETILTLGWRDFCMSESDDEMSWRARFCDLYDAKCQREREYGRMLPEVRQTITRRLGGATIGQMIAGLLQRPKPRSSADTDLSKFDGYRTE